MSAQQNNSNNSTSSTLDLIVIGSGINGAGIAADAAGRGLNVGLYEANDFASATSSASSKLIHGGLRYLEHYEFRLVSEALAEREVLLRKAPHVAQPMRFRLPHRPFLRPAWMIRCGLFLYDNLSKRTTLPGSKTVDLAKSGLLKPEMKTGFEYSDCWVDDARMVLLNVLAAKENNAEVRNYCRVEKAHREGGIWHVTILDVMTNQRFERKAKALVNAAGPWVKQFFDDGLEQASPRNIRLIKGSHIVVPRIHDEPQAYILQNKDNRIVFMIPYLDKFSIIGTTDLEYKGDPREVAIDDVEVDYLIDIVNQHFVKQLGREDVVWTYSGVRPLCDDESDSPQAITRDYTLELDAELDQAPLLSIFGGKLTTYRKLGEAALKKLDPHLTNMGAPWTANDTLPGGNFSCSREQLAKMIHTKYPWASEALLLRYVTQFGTYTWKLLEGANSEADLGTQFSSEAHGVYQVEIDYLINQEMAMTDEDILWRRTKLGLYMKESEQQAVTDYLKEKLQSKVVSFSQAG
ncbi:aerobic glycerol 3-phosphate dehydrogenase [Vibrio crassostreae]|uniref:glycerol-3-phosphate dehydrogenase n=1 Tax=Vibrio crassostreae TaxID=246167 RepID=UPI001042CAD5|nr:glycerol-3-phosphate dehydrogenase [Vibrio crassostreae]TCN84775.1 homodimeric glycerol 3-phosphate dehydrogenase (quinone) [Vibrio crassostreae]CAK2413977.1 aerobic glycerol 3-phosphate dehydrogenase [Vibrio crassostreae]CAK2444296.1 aerobic glycerol 3-phosphate dehydrogenase [Vibrio crassostreae]CAK3716502.1 aerobic glycerol 3-phosphate dehydrogenase [Vibrio crassostreae]CAK3782562.1 aerobic glycerol 3-phosphate dehydrogenase [Vibrio crassostreae]